MSIETKKKILKRKAQVDKNNCVACGTCANVCPLGAIKIVAGVFAEVDEQKCVGCSKCVKECPASVIEIITKEEVK
ncbi:4Fe-4S binding protein [Clostridium sp. SYSU_GA19001]|nr:4Fe-4S binding protein [Clostridium caldaquaticum]